MQWNGHNHVRCDEYTLCIRDSPEAIKLFPECMQPAKGRRRMPYMEESGVQQLLEVADDSQVDQVPHIRGGAT